MVKGCCQTLQSRSGQQTSLLPARSLGTAAPPTETSALHRDSWRKHEKHLDWTWSKLISLSPTSCGGGASVNNLKPITRLKGEECRSQDKSAKRILSIEEKWPSKTNSLTTLEDDRGITHCLSNKKITIPKYKNIICYYKTNDKLWNKNVKQEEGDKKFSSENKRIKIVMIKVEKIRCV